MAVVLDPRSAGEESHVWVCGAPDLAVEVLSPSDRSTSVHRKTVEYLEAGARLVWLVDPEALTVIVHRPDGSVNLLREHEILEGEILAGFSLELSELFQRT